MKDPFVSVIIPNYNHSAYLDQRIQSVLNQTYNDFEVIILDDKSTDNSVDVINKYKDNPHISHIVVNQQNSGSTFVQWNRGLSIAQGEVIWIAESDDYCESRFLDTCINEYVKDKNCAVVYTSSEYVDANGNDLGTYKQYDGLVYHLNGIDFIKQRMAMGCAIWNASSAIFSKAAALSLDKCYQSYKMCGDKLFWILMAEKGNIVHVNKVMNYFRQHQNKVSPKRFRDGTWLTEERQIFDYQCSKGYLTSFRKLYVYSLYYSKITTGDFDNINIKDRLISLWGLENSIKVSLLSLYSRLYQYIHIYIIKKPNL